MQHQRALSQELASLHGMMDHSTPLLSAPAPNPGKQHSKSLLLHPHPRFSDWQTAAPG